jgi:hypothetical protein
MQSKAITVQQYLAELPADRRAVLQAVREVILKNLDKNFEEGMQYGMIGYYVPHRIFPAGYHCDPRQPLPFGGLASQKNHMSVYLMGVYGGGEQEKRFRAAWAKTGKKLDMGKCCIRFKKLEDVALDVIGETIRRLPAGAYIEHYESAIRDRSKTAGAPKRTSPKKTAKPAASAKKSSGRTKPAAKKTARRAMKSTQAGR